jgi:hypothetical protein
MIDAAARIVQLEREVDRLRGETRDGGIRLPFTNGARAGRGCFGTFPFAPRFTSMKREN